MFNEMNNSELEIGLNQLRLNVSKIWFDFVLVEVVRNETYG
jgi:hypothetical protein